jgi:1-acyl-sn-glycerol-3-phosphate acyltransferase
LMGAIRVVKNGGAVLIFPEGSRSLDGRTQSAKPGLGMIASNTGAPVLPVKITGSFLAFPRNRIIPSLHHITIKMGIPVFAETKSFKDKLSYQKFSDRIMVAINSL